MKHFLSYIMALLFLIFAISCSDAIVMPEETDQVERLVPVSFETTTPLLDLPSTRAITDDSSISNYAVWVFSNGLFYDAIYPDDKYLEAGSYYPMLDLKSSGNLFVMLPEGLKNVTLAMVANVPDIKTKEPAKDTKIADANIQFACTTDIMPLYGVNSTPFDVTLGANGGVIVLRRAMAKVVVDASKASDHFELESIRLVYSNLNGTVRQNLDANANIVITNETTSPTDNPDREILGTVTNDNKASIYIPEIDLASQGDKRAYVIIGGKYKDANGEREHYYKLDFIAQRHTDTEVVYSELSVIQRNCQYVFDIQYLTDGTGRTTLEEAKDKEASNSIPSGSSVQLIQVQDQEINTVTTNNYIYLGLTADVVTASEGQDYYVANVSVVTNSADGWKFESLPAGVSLSIDSATPAAGEVVSVWIFLDKSQYNSGGQAVLYVYGNNIRKSVTVRVP